MPYWNNCNFLLWSKPRVQTDRVSTQGQTQQEPPGLHFSLACRGSSGPECLLLTSPPTALHVLISCFLESHFLSTRFFHHSKYYYIRMHISVPWSLVFYLSLEKNMLSMPLSNYRTHDIFLDHFIFHFQLLAV